MDCEPENTSPHDAASKQKRVAYVVSEDLVKVSDHRVLLKATPAYIRTRYHNSQVASLLPSNRFRSALVHQLVAAFARERPGWIRIIRPTAATAKDLLTYHDMEYVGFVLGDAPQASRFGVQGDLQDTRSISAELGLEDDCPPFKGLPAYVRMIAGASMTAARSLRDNESDVAICWDGGRHHARKSRASGFCYVADCVLAILVLKKINPRPKIMYIDLDLHFSDAVSEAFVSTSTSTQPTVLTLSIHHATRGFFPASELSGLTSVDTADPFTISVPLERGASAKSYAHIWESVEEVKAAFDPEYVVVQCGGDGLAGDPCAVFNWCIDVEEKGSMGWCVGRILEWKSKTLLLGGGGYNHTNTARAWAYLVSVATGDPLPVGTDIPDHRTFPQYQPSFTLDVPAGNMRDENTNEYLNEVKSTLNVLSARIRERLAANP
ncbi:hypothetical protein M407DRAFT_6876 [Tulasnella calospora MUT 4182]|uniref:histone deacetylase n=1 Tax=Tulasnella calospora MUT 4182 TaxID=1051891 RepID=A0A0C3QMS7_9AGAM|nr:hypothetical protein M407DRAFT_6876 [Tulasnella calospora MUT 4182]